MTVPAFVSGKSGEAAPVSASTAAPLVSVITPFFNAEAFFQQAIDSVLRQTYACWELLLVDDGSQDGSSAIALAAQAKDRARIRYLRHADGVNRGAGPARQLALAQARGEFVAFLDADDIWFPTKLASQVEALSRRPDVDLISGRTLFWHTPPREVAGDERDFVYPTTSGTGIRKPPEPGIHEPPELLTLLLRYEDIHPNCCYLVRHSACTGRDFPERLPRLYEDTAFLASLFLRSRVMISSECVAACRIHANSTCHRAMETGELNLTGVHPAREKYLRWLGDFLSEQGCADAEVWRALRRQLLPYRYPRLYRWAQKGKPLRKWLRNRLRPLARGRGSHSCPEPDVMNPASDDLTAARRQLALALGAAGSPATVLRDPRVATG
jgi:glycosyltransferase involved in cell wall biosynthesis